MNLDEAVGSLPADPDAIGQLLADKGLIGARRMYEQGPLAHYLALVTGARYARVFASHTMDEDQLRHNVAQHRKTYTADETPAPPELRRCGIDEHGAQSIRADVTLYTEYRNGDRRLISEAILPTAAGIFQHRFDETDAYPLLDAARLDFDPEQMWVSAWEQGWRRPMPDYIRRQTEPVGIKEIAERLGVQRATVDMWQSRGLFFPPRWTVGGRPAWGWGDVEKWAVETGRLPRGPSVPAETNITPQKGP